MALVRAARDVSIVGQGHWSDARLVAEEVRRLVGEALMPRGVAAEIRSAIYQLLMHSWHSGNITITRPMADLHAELSMDDYLPTTTSDVLAEGTREDLVSVIARVAAIALGEPVGPQHDPRDDDPNDLGETDDLDGVQR